MEKLSGVGFLINKTYKNNVIKYIAAYDLLIIKLLMKSIRNKEQRFAETSQRLLEKKLPKVNDSRKNYHTAYSK